MAKSIAFHFYKADMGRITIAANLPALLSKKSTVIGDRQIS